ncbi:YlzJ-like family protein [Paenibacillus sp. CAU 1782]
MTLYTTMPLELVLQNKEEERDEFLEVWSGGIRMQVVPVAPGVGRVVRLLECRLDDYLDPQYTPGSLIQYGLKVQS